MISIYDFSDYKLYLNEILPSVGSGRGQRSKLAIHLGCQTGFISQVISGESHFSLEHAIKVSEFLFHDKEETRFFMLLLNYSRAGSVSLRDFYFKQIEEDHQKRRLIKNRIAKFSVLDEQSKLIYYGQWYYAAIHIACSIKEYQSKKSISDLLNISIESVSNALKFLVEKNLVIELDGSFQIGPTRIHLSSEDPLIPKHHTNWRIESIKSLDLHHEKNLHYSGVFSLSQKDLDQIKDILLKSIEQSEKVIKDSPEEVLACLNIDWFYY